MFWYQSVAEYKPLLTFAIGEIPSRDVYHGDTLMFYVEADWLTDPNFQIVGITNEPAGSYSLDSVTGLFTYEPDDISDCTPFEITIRVTSGDGLIEEVQIVKITPVPDPLVLHLLKESFFLGHIIFHVNQQGLHVRYTPFDITLGVGNLSFGNEKI